jgi:hypothetical protein
VSSVKAEIEQIEEVFKCLEVAKQWQLEYEWMMTFIDEIRAGKPPAEAAAGALYEWDM